MHFFEIIKICDVELKLMDQMLYPIIITVKYKIRAITINVSITSGLTHVFKNDSQLYFYQYLKCQQNTLRFCCVYFL